MSARKRTSKVTRTDRESAEERRILNKRRRRAANQATRMGRTEMIERTPGTQGWNTY